jgi:hypothetical protein
MKFSMTGQEKGDLSIQMGMFDSICNNLTCPSNVQPHYIKPAFLTLINT